MVWRRVARLHCIRWDAAIGLRWAQLLGDLRSNGRAMPVKDSLIAEAAGATLVDPASADPD